MGVYGRPDSPFFWLLLERPSQKPIRERTLIPRDGGSPAATREMRRQAQDIYAKRMVELSRRRHHLPTVIEGRSFREHRAWYLENVTSHKRGILRERSMMKQLGVFFDRCELSEIDVTLVKEWRTSRRRDVSASTVNREEAILRHMLGQAVPKYLESNPVAGIGRLKTQDVETRILTPEEETDLLRAAAVVPAAHAAILCGLDALMRRGSIANLQRAQDHKSYLTLLNAKAGTYKVPVSDRLRVALDLVPVTGTRYFGCYWPGPEKNMDRMFADVCARGGVVAGRRLGGVTFHSLRHTGASRMLASGIDVKTVMLIGGWTNLTVMERYLHPTDARKREAVNSIGARS